MSKSKPPTRALMYNYSVGEMVELSVFFIKTEKNREPKITLLIRFMNLASKLLYVRIQIS